MKYKIQQRNSNATSSVTKRPNLTSNSVVCSTVCREQYRQITDTLQRPYAALYRDQRPAIRNICSVVHFSGLHACCTLLFGVGVSFGLKGSQMSEWPSVQVARCSTPQISDGTCHRLVNKLSENLSKSHYCDYLFPVFCYIQL